MHRNDRGYHNCKTIGATIHDFVKEGNITHCAYRGKTDRKSEIGTSAAPALLDDNQITYAAFDLTLTCS